MLELPASDSKQSRKMFILVLTMLTIINSTMGSALPSNATPFFMKEWGVESQTQKVLPISVFLIGKPFENVPKNLFRGLTTI